MKQPEVRVEEIICPFCLDDGFDQVGLRLHLSRWCEPFEHAGSDEAWAAFADARAHSSPPPTEGEGSRHELKDGLSSPPEDGEM